MSARSEFTVAAAGLLNVATSWVIESQKEQPDPERIMELMERTGEALERLGAAAIQEVAKQEQ